MRNFLLSTFQQNFLAWLDIVFTIWERKHDYTGLISNESPVPLGGGKSKQDLQVKKTRLQAWKVAEIVIMA